MLRDTSRREAMMMDVTVESRRMAARMTEERCPLLSLSDRRPGLASFLARLLPGSARLCPQRRVKRTQSALPVSFNRQILWGVL